MKQIIHKIYGWISPRFRRRRMQWFQREITLKPTDRILDVGGYPWFWREAAPVNSITLFNLDFPVALIAQYPSFTYGTGDGCHLPYTDRAFAVVFSNSVIEHVGTWERQVQFANEARRVGRQLWVQTPAREFFIEPHLMVPFLHWLPKRWQRHLLRNLTPWGWLSRPTPVQVENLLGEIRLIKRAEMRRLFPDCDILEEKFLGQTKSYIAVRRT